MKAGFAGIALAIVLSAQTASAETHSLVDGKITRSGEQSVAVPCAKTYELIERGKRLYVACGEEGVAVFRITSTGVAFAGNIKGHGCTALGADGGCAARADVPAEAPRLRALEDGKIVFRNEEGERAFPIACDQPRELVEHDDRIFVACGAQGIAVYRITA